ncbi:MAG: sulfotransferase [Candidatus Poribacteria bacterium]|nr:sulfotransferase [Candidatus Poribacteria bacterium]
MSTSRSATNKPDFLIIGAQKAGTTWLWRMLQQHPQVDPPKEKEIHFFGSAENYRNGKDWYYSHFAGLDRSKITGEASPTYFYDNVPYWYNQSRKLEVDRSLPTIPELITTELPNIKILVILRDPVRRAVSAYFHRMRRKEGTVSPLLGLKETAVQHPKIRILEGGYYARYLKLWRRYVPENRMRVLIFEEDVQKFPERTLRDVYQFLNLDPQFQPEGLRERVHPSWSYTRIVLAYYADPFSRKIIRSRLGKILDTFDLLGRFAIKTEDVKFLRSKYLPEKSELESLIGRSVSSWKYDL